MTTTTETELTTLTDHERTVMTVCTETEFRGAPWNFAVNDASGLSFSSYEGVVSSLIQKGLVFIEDYSYEGRPADMVFYLTREGAQVNTALRAALSAPAEDAEVADVR